MHVIRKINNNVVLCEDDDGKQLIALGRGLGFIDVGAEVDLACVERTFYDAKPEGWAFLDELNQEILGFSSQVIDIVRDWLPYSLSPNFAFTLADHLAFAIERQNKGIQVRMPLSYEIELQYPEEYRIGRFTCNRLQKMYDVSLPPAEIAGIAMCFVNNALASGGSYSAQDAPDGFADEFEKLLERSIEAVERTCKTTIDRGSFNYTRFAAHLQLLYNRVLEGVPLEEGGVDLAAKVREEYPEIAESVDEIARFIRDSLNIEISDDERLYLMLHVNRMCRNGAVTHESSSQEGCSREGEQARTHTQMTDYGSQEEGSNL